MKKIILSVLVSVMLVATMFCLTGCGENGANGGNNNNQETKKSKGNYDVFGCMEKLDPSMTLEKVNEVIGFEGTLKSDTESYKVYNWDLTDDTGISVQFHTKLNTATISANYPSSMVTENADFSKWSEIKAKLDKREDISYDKFVELVGGVQGKIKQKSSSNTSYTWQNAQGGYLSGYFDAKTNNCTMATGRF